LKIENKLKKEENIEILVSTTDNCYNKEILLIWCIIYASAKKLYDWKVLDNEYISCTVSVICRQITVNWVCTLLNSTLMPQ